MEEVKFWLGSEQISIPLLYLVIGSATALLLVGVALYYVYKVLRTKTGRLIGAALLVAAVGWWAIEERAQTERERVSRMWTDAFRDSSITDFETCVSSRTAKIYSRDYRLRLVNECGEVAKSIKQGLDAR